MSDHDDLFPYQEGKFVMTYTLFACHRGRPYCVPMARLLPEAEKSQWSSTTDFSSLVVVKIKGRRGWKSFCFETQIQGENSHNMLNRFRWQRGCVESVSSYQLLPRCSFMFTSFCSGKAWRNWPTLLAKHY